MRDIKFRAWNEYAKQMYDVDLLHIRNSTPQIPTTLEGNYMSLVYQPKVELMQYTGLRDKNGKEIYEGDFVLTSQFEKPAYVIWTDFLAQFSLEVREYYSDEDFNFNAEPIDPDIQLEVIGNIYKDPELLT